MTLKTSQKNCSESHDESHIDMNCNLYLKKKTEAIKLHVIRLIIIKRNGKFCLVSCLLNITPSVENVNSWVALDMMPAQISNNQIMLNLQREEWYNHQTYEATWKEISTMTCYCIIILMFVYCKVQLLFIEHLEQFHKLKKKNLIHEIK